MGSSETIARFRKAFPSVVQNDVDAALACVPRAEWPPSSDDIGPVVIDGEQLQIPYRIYSEEPHSPCLSALTHCQRLVLNAVYTRHANGFIRERHVKQLLLEDEQWIPPYVIQLLGEYVVEIIQILALHQEVFISPAYLRFAKENRTFINLLRQRITSYWNCYYGYRFRRLQDYPAFQIVELMDRAVRDTSLAAEQTLGADSP
jgi:hypothetical protein